MGIFEDLGDIAKGGGKVVDKTLDTVNPFTDRPGYLRDLDDYDDDYDEAPATREDVKKLCKMLMKEAYKQGYAEGKNEGINRGIKAMAQQIGSMTDEAIQIEVKALRKKYKKEIKEIQAKRKNES